MIKKYWKVIVIGLAILVILYFIQDCQVDRIMKKSLEKDLKSQAKIQKLEKQAGELEVKIYDIKKVKDEIIKENELLKNQKPKPPEIIYEKIDNKKYILKSVFDNRELYWYNYSTRIQDQFDSYIKADKAENEFNRKLILTLRAEVTELKSANLNLKSDNLKLYKKAKGWLYFGLYAGYDALHDTWAGGVAIEWPLFKIK